MINANYPKRLAFYEISQEYIDFLKKYEDKVPNIKYETREKFICGVMFKVNGYDYYAPISSFNTPQKTNFLIEIGEYPVGSIRFSFMIPVPKDQVKLKDFSNEDKKYVRLVKEELVFCNIHMNAITKKAQEVYEYTNEGISIYKIHCCDFTLLESKCQEWIQLKSKELDTSIDKNFIRNNSKTISLKERIDKAIEIKRTQNRNESEHKKPKIVKEHEK